MPFALIVGAIVTVTVFYLLAESVVRSVKARRPEAMPSPAKDPLNLVRELRLELENARSEIKTLQTQQLKLSDRVRNLEAIVSSEAWDELNRKS